MPLTEPITYQLETTAAPELLPRASQGARTVPVLPASKTSRTKSAANAIAHFHTRDEIVVLEMFPLQHTHGDAPFARYEFNREAFTAFAKNYLLTL
jgi:hypothetical protein